MKKFLTIICACAMALGSLYSCSDKKETSEEDSALIINSSSVDEAVLKPIHNYLDGYNEKNAELVMSSFVPEPLINEMKEKGVYEEEIERVKGNIDATFEMWEETYGENSSISFGGELNNSTLSAEYLDLASKYFELTYYDLDTKIELEEGYEISYMYTIKGDNSQFSGTEKACHVKVKGSDWVLLFCDAETLENYKDAPADSEESDESTEESNESTEE